MALYLADIIQSRIALGNPSAKGFHPVKCELCNDHSPRAGFVFSNEFTGYNCFNCKASFRYQELSGNLSKNCREVLHAFGIREQELNEFSNSLWFHNKGETPKEISLEQVTSNVSLHTPEISLPPDSIQITDCETCQPFIKYLSNRKLDWQKLRPYYSNAENYKDRIIIPVFRNGKVVFWQARTILKNVKPRYRSAFVSKDAVIWGYHHLFNEDPNLFITEGIFDASLVNGIALLGSTITPSQLELISKSRKRKVIIVDRDENGKELANQAIQKKWDLAFLPDGVKDVNDSVLRYGHLYTAYHLMNNIFSYDSLETELRLNLF